jgi:XTP/dITP diphosphohydrolase
MTNPTAPPRTRIVVATGNAHKVAEIAAAVSRANLPFQFIALSEYVQSSARNDAESALVHWTAPVEDGDSFEANAAIKARAAWELLGLPALADDSGLEVEVLSGAPGVYSSRYAGVDGDDAANNEKLLREMDGVDGELRGARFVSTLVLVGLDQALPDAPAYLTVRGTVEGRIATTPRGRGGFGYDPLFLPNETPGRSMAQLSQKEKNAISHRGNALRALTKRLTQL